MVVSAGLLEHLWMLRMLRADNENCVSISWVPFAHCKQGKAREMLNKTQQQERKIKDADDNLVLAWECKAPGYKPLALEPKTVIYPHALVYDFEAYTENVKNLSV